MDRVATQIIEFYISAVEKRDVNGNPFYEDREFVRITNPEGRDVVEREVKESDKIDFLPHYQAFKQGIVYEGEGTKLRDVSFLSKSELETLKRVRIFTVEQLASVDENGMKAIGMGARELIKKANNWLDSRNGTDALVNKINALEKRLEDQEELVNLVKSKDQILKQKDMTIIELQEKLNSLLNNAEQPTSTEQPELKRVKK